MFSLLLKGSTPPCYDIISSERSSFRASPGVFIFQLSLTVNSEYGIFTDFNGDLDLIELGIYIYIYIYIYKYIYIYTLFYFYDVCLVIVFFLFSLSVCFDYLLLSDVGGRTWLQKKKTAQKQFKDWEKKWNFMACKGAMREDWRY